MPERKERKIPLRKIIRFLLASLLYMMSLSFSSQAGEERVIVDILNKISAKKHRVEIPIGSAYVIQDIRLVPRSCRKEKGDLGNDHMAHIQVFMEQDGEEKGIDAPPILLYDADLINNPRFPSSPLEHPIYDIIFVKCRTSS